VSRYPCPTEDLNLQTISFLRERYGITAGFSDHSIGTESAIAAAALGACVIEKHFSFDRSLWGSDHKVSLTPDELRQLVEGVRNVREDAVFRDRILGSEIVQKGMGSAAKILDDGEAVFRPLFRKSLVVGADLPAGTVIDAEHLYAMRPQAHIPGLPSEMYPDILGKRLRVPLKRYQPLTQDMLDV
jgi:sialic acid synthase SpsE